MLEVHVDVRRLVALLADEALEQDGHARRIDLGDAQAVADHAVGGRAPALAQDVAAACESDDVVDGQEVVLVLQLADQGQLMLDLLLHLGGRAFRPAPPCPFVSQAPQKAGRRLARRHDLIGVLVLQLVQREVTALRDPQGLVHLLG